MSLYPPHLIDSKGSLTPSALIPFCAYQTNMTLLGQTRQDLPFTVCSQFQPTVLEGQLCYSLNLSKIAQNRAKPGLKFGLVLILDPSEKEHTSLIENSDEMTSLSFETFTNVESSARIYLNTLASFSAYQAGSYALSALKKMTGTEGFLNLPSKVKGCKTETFEECHATRYIKEVHKQCGCVPWAIGLNQKVRLKFPANPLSPPSGRCHLLPQFLLLLQSGLHH